MRITAFHLLTVLMQLSVFVSASTINVPANYSTIQAAPTAAQSGDTVLVLPGPKDIQSRIVIPGDSQTTRKSGKG